MNTSRRGSWLAGSGLTSALLKDGAREKWAHLTSSSKALCATAAAPSFSGWRNEQLRRRNPQKSVNPEIIHSA